MALDTPAQSWLALDPQEAAKQVALGSQIMSTLGEDLTLGHVSVRHACGNLISIKRKGISLAEVGPDDVIVVDLNNPDGLKVPGMPDDRETGRWPNNRAENSLRGPSGPTCPSDDETAPGFAFAGCGPCRRSPLSTHPSTTTSTRSAGSPADTLSMTAVVPLSPSGVTSVRPDAQRLWAIRDWFASV